MATLKKIEAMHKQFGALEGKKCGDCSNLTERQYDHKYFKCAVYGMSHSTSSDWAKRWTACGMFNKECVPNRNRVLSVPEIDNKPMDGQINMDELTDSEATTAGIIRGCE